MEQKSNNLKLYNMKKLTLLFALLCASVMGWSQINWDDYSYLGCDAGGGYGNQFKVKPDVDQNVASIQNFQGAGWGIYTSFNGKGAITNVSGVSSYRVDGAGVCLHCASFEAKETQVTVTCALGSFNFVVYNENGSNKTASDLTITSTSSVVLDVAGSSTITYTTSSTGAVSFLSSNPSIATVDNNGVITAVGAGEAEITVSQASDDTYFSGNKKVSVTVNMAKKASSMGYGSLILENVDLYDWNGNFAGNSNCGKADLYVVTYGKKLIYKAVIKEGKTFENCTNYFCQLRTWKDDLTEMREQWAKTCSNDLTTRYLLPDQATNAEGLISAYGNEIKLTSYMVITGCGARTMKTVSYTRDYLNNYDPSDVTAPVLGAANISSSADAFTISFDEVISEAVFYMIEDVEHDKKFYSMLPSFEIPKDGTGITYNYSCYAIDFSGNVSAAQPAEITMPFSPVTNLALNKPCYANSSENADRTPNKANDGSNDSRWSSGGVTAPELAWWAVDLGAIYNLSSIEMVWEGAYSDNFIIYGAENKPTAWNDVAQYESTLVTNTVAPTTGADKNNVYSVSGHARYLLFMPSHVYNNGWGASFYEFRAYATSVYDPSAGVDTEDPVITDATLASKTHNSAVVTLTASDDIGIVKVKVVDAANNYEQDLVPEGTTLTITGLDELTTYNFTLTAYDAVNNTSNTFVMDAFETLIDPNIPQTAAPTPPARGVDDVRAVYSDAYTDILQHQFGLQAWGSANGSRRVRTGDNYLLYNMSAYTWIALGVDNDGADAIVAKDGYHGVGTTGLDASGMANLHVDIWSNVELAHINIFLENTKIATVSHDGTGWNQFNVEFTPAAAANIRFMKFDGIDDTGRGMFALDNIYFWTTPSGVKSVTVSSNNNNMGSASATVNNAEVTSVTEGTEVTFTATPASGYEFVYWTIGSDRVYQNPYVMTVNNNVNAVATFEAPRTAYCSVPVTNSASHTIYLTINATGNTNEYRILFEGSSNCKITNSHDNIQFRLSHVNGSEGTHHFVQSEWTVDASGYGSIYTTFTAADFHDITIVNTYIPLATSNSAGEEFSFPTNDASLIKWDASCADNDAPVLAAPSATAIGPKSVRLELSATDEMASVLTYHINYKPTGDTGSGENDNLVADEGTTAYKVISGLTPGVEYTFTISVSDGTNESAAQACTATPAMSAAPVPSYDAKLVRSIYSDAFESMLNADFGKKSFANNDLTWEEMNVNGDKILFYDLLPYTNDAAFALGGLVAGDIFVAKEEYRGEYNTPDISNMTYLHVDVWSNKATQYAEVQINGYKLGEIPLTGLGWQSFDLPLETFREAHLEELQNLKHINFVGLRTPNPEQVAIDNVYFYAVLEDVEFVDNGNNDALIAAKHKHFVNATINRSFAANGEWFTICLPFDMDADKVNEVFGASTIAEMVGAEDRGSLIHLNFDYINEMKAGKAYLIRPGQDFAAGTTIQDVQIKNVDPATVKSANAYMEFQGTFNQITLDQDNQRFVGPENYLYSPAANGTTMKAFRCYFTIPANAQNNVMGKRAKIVFGPQQATDIDQIENGQSMNAKIMIDGVLYIIRDGKTYNAQGQKIQ